MKKNFYYSLLVISGLLFFVSACKKNEVINPVNIDNTDVNGWIYAKMKEYYLWESEMKSVSETDLFLPPADYFESLLVQPGVLDRFSWIDESAENLRNSLDGLGSTYGFKYMPFYADPAKTRITFSVTYSLKNSVAERMGIKRGDLITKVNGVNLTLDNYKDALKTETVTLTMGKYNNGTIEDTQTAVELTKELTQTEALQYNTILELGGKKIGYLVYTQFLTTSDKKINSVFGEFKNAGIDELIVDLRYNPGGYISSAEILSSLIVKNLNPSNLMTRQIWNTEQTAKRNSSDFDTYFFTSRNNLGQLNNLTTINRVYFLVSNGSASASEMLVNNLKPYMDVVLVGTHTYGKNVGSITIDDTEDPKRFEWGMQPIVLKTVNGIGESDYGTKEGFKPTIEIEENKLPFKPFGDPDERILNTALTNILGAGVLAKANQNVRKTPSSTFVPLANEAVFGDPLLDRKEMWVTEYPSGSK